MRETHHEPDKQPDQRELLAASNLVKPFLSQLKTGGNTLTQRRAYSKIWGGRQKFPFPVLLKPEIKIFQNSNLK